MNFRSLHAKLIVLILLALVPLGILVVRETATEYRERREALEVEAIWYAGVLGGTQQAILETVRQLLMTLAQVEFFHHPEAKAEGRRLLQELTALNTVYDNIAVCDAEGNPLACASRLGNTGPQGNALWFNRVRESRKLSAGRMHLNPEGKWVVSVGYPIFDREGSFNGAVFVDIDLVQASRYNVREPMPVDGILTAVSAYNDIFLYYPDPEQWIGKEATWVDFGKALGNRHSATFTGKDAQGEERLYAVQRVNSATGDSFYIGIGVRVPEGRTGLERAQVHRLAAVAGIGLAVLLASWVIGSRYVVEPTRHLVGVARAASRGDLRVRSTLPPAAGEFHEIGSALNQMADSLGRRITELDDVRHALQQAHGELETRVAERTEELRRSNAELEEFAYVASHDLQEPLRMVASYTQLLARRYEDRLDADGRDFIHYAVDGAERMQAFIRDLLQYSRVGTQRRPFEAVDTAALLRQVLENFRFALEEVGGKVVLEEPLPTVMGDPMQLAQLFQNLIGNALKFRSQEPPRIRVSASVEGGMARFTVQDNGIGLDPADAGRIFVIFQRLHSRDEYEGTGIGLSICKKIVERHGGRIGVDSRKGEGAAFYFTLPLA